MRSSMLWALIAATLLTPVAATAQERPNRGERGDAMGQRFRAERPAFRGERLAPSPARPQFRQDQQVRQGWRENGGAFRTERRDDGGAFRTERRDDGGAFRTERRVDGGAFRSERRDDGGAFRSDRGEAREAFRTERRDARQDFRAAIRPDRQEYRAGTIDREQFDARRAEARRDFAQDRRDDRGDVRNQRRDDRGEYRREYRAGTDNSRRWNERRGWDNDRRDWNDRREWNDRRDWSDRNGRRDGDARGEWNGRRGFVGGRDWGDNRSWNRGWRAESRYDWRAARYHNRAAYHLPRYYAPRGWGYGYQRFGIGATLSSVLWAQSYWLDDPIAYRLPPASGPYRWVRYYNDALLVDVETGEVVDIEYDIFW